MATAKARTKTVTKTVEEEVEDGYDLHVTKREADAIVAVVAAVGGDVYNSPRADLASVSSALLRAGAGHWIGGGNEAQRLKEKGPGVYFRNYPATAN